MRLIISTILSLSYFHALTQHNPVTLTGKISYKNSQNVYVRFQNTKGISIGDTLYISQPVGHQPVLIVRHLSSISCVTTSIADRELNIGDVIMHRSRIDVKTPADIVPVVNPADPEGSIEPENEMDRERLKPERPAHLRGRLAVGSYTNFSGKPSETTQRMRYTFSLDASNINHSRFSVESYMIFRHKAHEWSEVRENIASALKVYNLAVRYAPDDQTEITLGRKITRNLTNVGAIDGLQIARTFQNFTLGAMVGTRPDTYDYNLNLKLLQFGGFVSHQRLYEDGGNLQTSLAFLEQKHHSNTDRRFLYFQHSNSLFKNLHIFGSVEMDLYKIEQERSNNTIRPTSIFLSLNYRVSRKLSLATSYDARKNVIYYETYKNFIDQLIDQETRQGMRFRINYRPFKYVTIGSSAGYRYQKDRQNTSKNLYSFLSFSQLPWVKVSATLSGTLLQSNYLQGNIYGLRLSKDFFDGKLYSEVNYRQVNYRYGQADSKLKQNILALGLSGSITRKLSLSVNYEATLEKGRTSNRIYSNIIQRF